MSLFYTFIYLFYLSVHNPTILYSFIHSFYHLSINLFIYPFILSFIHSSIIYLSFSPIDSSREQVLDAAAVYFIVPSDGNIKRICRDLHNHLYDTYYFNFITPIPRPLLEELAKAAVDANCISQVTKVRYPEIS